MLVPCFHIVIYYFLKSWVKGPRQRTIINLGTDFDLPKPVWKYLAKLRLRPTSRVFE